MEVMKEHGPWKMQRPDDAGAAGVCRKKETVVIGLVWDNRGYKRDFIIHSI